MTLSLSLLLSSSSLCFSLTLSLSSLPFPPLQINWYTKRGIAGSIYVATEVYMLTDKSPDFKDTWDFLERRMADAAMAGSLPSEVRVLSICPPCIHTHTHTSISLPLSLSLYLSKYIFLPTWPHPQPHLTFPPFHTFTFCPQIASTVNSVASFIFNSVSHKR